MAKVETQNEKKNEQRRVRTKARKCLKRRTTLAVVVVAETGTMWKTEVEAGR